MSEDQAKQPEVNPKLIPLLSEINADEPSGASLRYDATFDKIKEARREDENLPRGIWEHELKKADWARVADLCQTALQNETKDLQVAAWLAESWLQLEGLPGLTRGIELVQHLSTQYWATIHPQIENGDLEFRMAPLEWINDHLGEMVRFIKITSPADAALGAFSWADFYDANTLDANARRHKDGQKIIEQAAIEGRPTLPKLTLSLSQTPVTFFRKLWQQGAQALEGIQSLESALYEVSPGYMPSFYRLKTVLGDIQRFLKGQIEERQPMSSLETEIGETQDENDVRIVAPEAFQLPPIASRGEAYARLSQAAEYLIRTEPHSPAPYLVKRAVAWGNMTLSELYQELIQDEKDLASLKQLLGVRGQSNKNVA